MCTLPVWPPPPLSFSASLVPCTGWGLLKMTCEDSNLLGASVTASSCHFRAWGLLMWPMLSLLCLFTQLCLSHSSPHWLFPTNLQSELEPRLVPVTHYSVSGQGCQQTELRSNDSALLPGLTSQLKVCPVHHQLPDACPAIGAPACHLYKPSFSHREFSPFSD